MKHYLYWALALVRGFWDYISWPKNEWPMAPQYDKPYRAGRAAAVWITGGW